MVVLTIPEYQALLIKYGFPPKRIGYVHNPRMGGAVERLFETKFQSNLNGLFPSINERSNHTEIVADED